MTSPDFGILAARLRLFAAEREWEQFHTPKNLSMARAGEAGELLEIFQWLTPEESSDVMDRRRVAVTDELADVLIYLVRLADVLDVDLMTAAMDKVERNETRYPPGLARGNAGKYDELG